MVKKLFLLISIILLCGCSLVGQKSHSIEDIQAMHRIYTRLGEENELDEALVWDLLYVSEEGRFQKIRRY